MDMRSATVWLPSRISCTRSACDRGCARRGRSYFLQIVRDQGLGRLAASLQLGLGHTVASAWFSFTPRASRRWASKPSWDMTSLSSCYYVVSRVRPQAQSIQTSLGHSCIVTRVTSSLWQEQCDASPNWFGLYIYHTSLHLKRPAVFTSSGKLRGSAAIKTRADKEPAHVIRTSPRPSPHLPVQAARRPSSHGHTDIVLANRSYACSSCVQAKFSQAQHDVQAIDFSVQTSRSQRHASFGTRQPPLRCRILFGLTSTSTIMSTITI